MSIRRFILLALTSLGLAGCQTTGSELPSTPVSGGPLAANEVLIADGWSRSMLYKNCPECMNDGGALQVRMRLVGNNYIVKVAYAPPPGRSLDPGKVYRVGFMWDRIHDNGLKIMDFTFAGGERVTHGDGRTYWVSDWLWNAATYNHLVNGKNIYLGYYGKEPHKKQLESLDHIRAKMAAGEKVLPWSLAIDFQPHINYRLWRDRYLSGEAAIAALNDPESAYERHFAAMDAEMLAHRQKKKDAQPANKAYRAFVARNLVPLTVDGLLEEAKCPGLPYPIEYNYHPAQKFYDQAGWALQRADCYNRVLNAYDPGALADRYEEVSEEESRLYAETFEQKRFTLQGADKQTRLAAGEINTALKRADYLFKGGDYTARKRAQKRREQQQSRAQMQALMSGLQGIQNTLQQRHDLAASRVAALQAQGVNNYRRKLEAQRSGTAALSAKSAVSAAANSSRSSSASTASSSSGAAQTASMASGPMFTVYQASTTYKSLPSDIAHCDPGVFDAKRAGEIKCRAVELVTLPMLFTDNIDRKCTGNPDLDTVEAYEATIIGGIYSMNAVTRDELAKLKALGDRRNTKTAAIFHMQHRKSAAHELVQWRYAWSRKGFGKLYFQDRTELVSYVRKHNCTAIEWTRPDNSTWVERLNKVR
jgi:vacuolar-type H+-ATPase subunit E/Vma4